MERKVPSSTYRLQLSPTFGLDDARRRLPYLARLGVDTLYLSPIWSARPGSPHGYDTIDPGRVDAARGGPAALRRLGRAAKRYRMGLLLDIVPNHLAASLENPAWREILRRGPRSRHAAIFDVDWRRTPDGSMAVVLPWLDRSVGASFAQGVLAFAKTARGLTLRLGAGSLPMSSEGSRRVREWAAEEGARPRLAASRPRRDPLSRVLDDVNRGTTPLGRHRRRELLLAQHYRLLPWRNLGSLNYRRFFDISELVGVRSEEPGAFAYMHRGILSLGNSPGVRGVRVDHVDGLGDPLQYLRRLAHALRPPGRRGPGRPPYIVVEKILAPDESLRPDWPVAGTTGYDALHRITGVLLPPGVGPAVDTAYRRACPRGPRRWTDVAYRAKEDVERSLFPSERSSLVMDLLSPSDLHRSPERAAAIDQALSQVTAALPVYRTYVRGLRVRPEDLTRVRTAFSEARRRNTTRKGAGGLADLARRWPGLGPSVVRPGARRFLSRWQQWTSAVTAKGVEDTAFYRYPRLLALNEVGGDPGRIGIPLEEFHRFMGERARRWPNALTPTSTHDTKWGEDARSRLIALAEWAGPWGRAVSRWRRDSRTRARAHDSATLPGPAAEYRLYQTVVATAPVARRPSAQYLQRLRSYAVKAVREAKERTSWLRPNAEYEDGVVRFVHALGHDLRTRRAQSELAEWIRRVAFFGAYYSLDTLLLRVTVPGVPDLYQGSEGWNLSLVDPDNRRPVSFHRLERMLASPDASDRGRFLPPTRGGPVPHPPRESDKVGMTAQLLWFRRAHRELFGRGTYVPLAEVAPEHGAPTVCFARRRLGEWVIVAIGRGLAEVSGHRLVPPVGACWGERRIRLPRGAPEAWHDVLTGRRMRVEPSPTGPQLRLAELFARWPFAVLAATIRDPPRRGAASSAHEELSGGPSERLVVVVSRRSSASGTPAMAAQPERASGRSGTVPGSKSRRRGDRDEPGDPPPLR